MSRYLIFDLGASNGRAVVAQVIEDQLQFEITHNFDNRPVVMNNGEFFWDIPRLYSEIKIGLKKSLKQFDDIKSMAIDIWGCDFGFLDSDDRLINSVLTYRDQNQHDLSEKLHSILSEEELFQLSGGPTNRIMGIYKLFSMKENNFLEYREGKSLLMMPDIFNFMLTGKKVNEFTNATMTLLVNQNTRSWEKKIFEKLNLKSDFLNPIVEPGTNIGPIKKEVCEELGIAPIDVIVPATHDTAAAVSGIPCKGNQDWGFISLGTWGLAGFETEKPVMDERIVPFQFGNEGSADGKNLLLKNITGLWIIQQCREAWLQEYGDKVTWDYICEEARDTADEDSFIDVDDPIFGQIHSSMPKVIKDYCKKTGQPIPVNIGAIARCVFKSMALKFNESFQQITSVIEKRIEVLHVVGGGSQNKLLCQWIADAMNTTVVAGPVETTVTGNFLFQLLADGTIKDLNEGRELSANSSDLHVFSPSDSELWEKIKDTYNKKINKDVSFN